MQRIEFNLQSALDGAKLVTGSGVEAEFVEYDRFDHHYPLKVTIGGISECYTDNGKYSRNRDIPNLDLFILITPASDIIGNSITEPPMMTAEAWYNSNRANGSLNTKIALMQAYGNYVADYLTKNK